ncbi:S8 family serine peptidase, partial [Candidatus Pacearchaeota archaeon]|nr:S8 family serine peptidase [Candidatus Pacearchaeota archaeon]
EAIIISNCPENTYLIRAKPYIISQLNSMYFIQWIGVYDNEMKISSEIKNDGLMTVRFFNNSNPDQTINSLRTFGEINNVIYDSMLDHYKVSISTSLSQLSDIASIPDVIWISPASYVFPLEETSAEIIGGNFLPDVPCGGAGHAVNLLHDLWGTGVKISICDSGLGNGNAGSAGISDLSTRVLGGRDYGTLTSGWADDDGHGTHVAGIAAGNGAISGVEWPKISPSLPVDYYKYLVGQGVAPEASLYSQKIFDQFSSVFGVNIVQLLPGIFDEAETWGVYVHQNSWGDKTDGVYDDIDYEFDRAARDANDIEGDQPLILVVAAGNWRGFIGEAEPRDYYEEVWSPGNAKNVITVGASDNYRPASEAILYGSEEAFSANDINEVASFSIRGPTADGRIKPDVVAPGSNILSCVPPGGELDGYYTVDDRYAWASGTSMAAPHVSGAAALITEWWGDNNEEARPMPATVKALLINTAVDMGDADIPNKNEGWGRVFLPPIFDQTYGMDIFESPKLLSDTDDTYETVIYPENIYEPLKITLVWTDPADLPIGIGGVLCNNLNLKVTAPDGSTKYYGN